MAGGAQSVGSIYYTVEADTGSLLDSGKAADAALDDLQRGFDKTDARAKRTEFQMTRTATAVKGLGNASDAAGTALSRLTGILGGLVALRGVEGIAQMADAWTDLQNRLRLVTASTEELNAATNSVFQTAQETSQEVGSVAQVYQRFAQNASRLGITLDDVGKLTNTVAKAIAVSGSSAGAAEAALVQFGQALASGTLRGDELNSIMEQTPGLTNAIAKGLGVTVGELRSLGAQGKITGQQLVQALENAATSVDEQFATRTKTIAQSFTELRNSMLRFVGESNNTSGASQAVSAALSGLAENIDAVAKLLLAAGAGALAKYVAGLGQTAIASARAALAARAQALQELQTAQAQAAATAATLAHAEANAGLTGTYAAATAAAIAHRNATLAVEAAQIAAARAGGSVLAVLGGPAGIIALVAAAAAGFLLFGSNAAQAAPQIDELARATENLNAAQLALRRQQVDDAIVQLQKKADEAAASVKGLEKDYDDLAKLSQSGRGVSAEELNNVNKALIEQRAAQDSVNTELQKALDLQKKLQNQVAARPNAPAGEAPKDPEVQKRLQALRDEAELAKLTGEARARLAAIQKLGENATAAERAEAEKLGAEIYRLQQAQAVLKKSTKDSATEAKENSKVIADLAQQLAEASLRGEELAVVKAKGKLNKFATDEDVKKVTDLATQLYEVTQQGKNADVIKNLTQQLAEASVQGANLAEVKALNQLNEFATPEEVATVTALARAVYNLQQAQAQRQKFGTTPQEADKEILGNTQPLRGGAFNDQVARYQAEAKAEEQRYAEQQARLQKARELQVQTNLSYDQLEEQMRQQHADRMNQIDAARNQVMLKSGEDAFAALADVTKTAVGDQSAAYKVLFAASKAFAIAQSIVAIQTGIAQAAAAPWPLNLAAMASVAAATASIISSIQGVTLGSGRQYGGSVSPNKLHRINENGAPEILNTASGRQYLLPNSRGEVISNADAMKSGAAAQAVNVNVRLIEDSERAGTVTSQRNGNDVEVDAFVADIMGGGRRSQAIQTAFNLRRRGT